MPSPNYVALVTRAIGLLNEAMALDYKPFDRGTDIKELDRLGFSEYSKRELELNDQLGYDEYCVRERELDRARACMLRAIATPEQRAEELAAARERLEDHHRPIVDQLILELGFRDIDGALLGTHFVPDAQYIQDIGVARKPVAKAMAKAAKVSRGRRAA